MIVALEARQSHDQPVGEGRARVHVELHKDVEGDKDSAIDVSLQGVERDVEVVDAANRIEVDDPQGRSRATCLSSAGDGDIMLPSHPRLRQVHPCGRRDHQGKLGPDLHISNQLERQGLISCIPNGRPYDGIADLAPGAALRTVRADSPLGSEGTSV
eukprot:758079-Hanusia_phi.AAC.4